VSRVAYVIVGPKDRVDMCNSRSGSGKLDYTLGSHCTGQRLA